MLKINGNDLYYSIIKGSQKVIGIKNHLNKINVFPVPDGDTGTNLSYTMNKVISQAKRHESAEETLKSISQSAIEGARGNSGVIMAQYLSGFYKQSRNLVSLTEQEFAHLFKSAYEAAIQAVNKPVEGSILTVMRDFSDSLSQSIEGKNDLTTALEKAHRRAKISLAETQYKMKVLKEAGVVDSGAGGFVAFVEGIYEFFKEGRKAFAIQHKTIPTLKDHHEKILARMTLTYRYCFELLIELKEPLPREELEVFGDSIVVAGNDNLMKIHIHTNVPQDVVAWVGEKGFILEQKIDDMIQQQKTLIDRPHPIAVITDSIGDLPGDFIDKHNIFVIPLNLTIDNIEYLDRVTITPDRFFDLADASQAFPRSAMPKIRDLERLFEFVSDHFDEALIITVSANISGTYNLIHKVLLEHENYGMQVALVDSKRNSGAQGLLVAGAIDKLRENPSLEALKEAVEAMIPRSRIYVSVDDFTYMVRGGRVSPLKGKLAKSLNLKPIITLDEEGKGKAFASAFSRKQNFKKIQNIIKKDLKDHDIVAYNVVHSKNPELARSYEKVFTRMIGRPPLYVEEISPIVGISSGKGAVAISYILKDR